MKNASFIFDPIFHIFNTMPQVGWDRTGWEAFKYMLFDPDNGTILTRCNLKYKGKYRYTSKLKFTNLFCRTPLSWLKITVFYIIYYTLLACFWIACLVIFFQVYNAVLILLQNYSLNFEQKHKRWKSCTILLKTNFQRLSPFSKCCTLCFLRPCPRM